MLSRSQAKYIKSLHQHKYRQKHKAFIVEGVKLVDECTDSDLEIQHVYAVKDWISKYKQKTIQKNIPLDEVSERELKSISTLKTPNQVLAIIKIPEIQLDYSNLFDEPLLVLDEIKDPGNLGTILRNAAWFGISTIVCSETCVETYNPKVIQATMGSFKSVTVHYTNLPEFFAKVPKDLRVFGTFVDGENIYKKQLPDKGVIIIGNESKGIGKDLFPFITDRMAIPAWRDGAESLNAAVACGIVLSEFRRRKLS